MVKIDRLSGKRVTGADPGDDPKSAVIWEAFKADTEPRRKSNIDDFVARRDAMLAEVRRAREPKKAVVRESSDTTETKDFAEERGGVY